MTPSARIEAAIQLWGRIRKAPVPMDVVCGDFFRNRTYIGSKDRASIAERVYAIMRHYARTEYALSRVTPAKAGIHDDGTVDSGLRRNDGVGDKIEISDRLFVAADLILREGADIAPLFDGTKYGPEALSDDERAILEKLAPTDSAPEWVVAECPPDHLDTLKTLFGDAFADEMAAMQTAATLDARVNLLKGDRDKALAMLKAQGIKASATQYSPVGIRFDGKVFLSTTKAFLTGLIDIQDEGSQMIAQLCGVQAGMQVLDACAGAGGKTLALAAAMENKGRIVAMDIDTKRLDRGRPRYKRAGIHNIEVRGLDDEQHKKWLRRQKETFDVVLIDAPCSSTGTWRRNPDLRWIKHGLPMEELLTVQSEILDRFAKCVKPGGRLVYATCSLLPQEDEDQVNAFLARHPEYELLPLDAALNGAANPCPNANVMRLTPRQHNTDGFFAAVMVRKTLTE